LCTVHERVANPPSVSSTAVLPVGPPRRRPCRTCPPPFAPSALICAACAVCDWSLANVEGSPPGQRGKPSCGAQSSLRFPPLAHFGPAGPGGLC
jgi:hypothetical protein